ncbi:MAG: DnaJ like chaperone protein [Oleiphilaceae bacterium]|jgi:DnaJ like chaperone protein
MKSFSDIVRALIKIQLSLKFWLPSTFMRFLKRVRYINVIEVVTNMFFLGKMLGGLLGFLLIGSNLITHLCGMTLGIFLGHIFERTVHHHFNESQNTLISQEKEEFFFESIFSVMGNIAKTKVQLTETDIQVANVYLDLAYHQEENFIASEFNLLNALQTTKSRMNMQRSFVEGKDNALLNSLQATKQRMLANLAFSTGKKNNFSQPQTLSKLAQIIGDNKNILQIFLGIQIQLAYTYGDPHSEGKNSLHNIGEKLGFSPFEVNRLVRIIGEQQRFYQPKQQQANECNYYQILGIKERASAKDIKRAYRKQMSLYHPDKLASKGLPEELMQQATEKTQSIQEAYETLRRS